MSSKINFKAKIDRHSRILKDDIYKLKSMKKNYYKFSYRILVLWIAFVLPVYPILWNTETNFYRWDIDLDSIIDSYIWIDGSGINISWEWYISLDTQFSWSSDVGKNNTTIKYKVKDWDTLESLAQRFDISKDTIIWANNLSEKPEVKSWDILDILPVTWVLYSVKYWDTISAIAQSYDIPMNDIITQNNLYLDGASRIYSGQELMLPWAAKKRDPKPVVITQMAPSLDITNFTPNTTTNTQKDLVIPKVSNTPANNTTSNIAIWTPPVQLSESTYVNTSWIYQLKKTTSPLGTFVWWNCTWFVDQYKNVIWRWNANQWYRNAQLRWVPVWQTRLLGSIVVFDWPWYNRLYGHVGIVVDMTTTEIIIKDMNYRRLNEVTTRKVSKNDVAIKWYIYAED